MTREEFLGLPPTTYVRLEFRGIGDSFYFMYVVRNSLGGGSSTGDMAIANSRQWEQMYDAAVSVVVLWQPEED